MRNRREIGFGGSCVRGVCPFPLYVFLLFFVFISIVSADLGPENVLILVNQNSATSQYVVKMYREYYPSIQDNQVLQLSGLADCSGPTSTAANEIITRDVYNSCIAEPVRQHLLDHELLDQVMVIVTTAGVPYRIEDTKSGFANVVYPGGSDWTIVMNAEEQVDAASVESELTCLWYSDYGSNPAGLQNRIVNPYQGCRSQFDLFARDLPSGDAMNWCYALSLKPGVAPPYMEGTPYGYGTINRKFGPGHMYLVCRLDGPKQQGKSAIFAVREILERSSRASVPTLGVNPNQAAAMLDDAPLAPSGNFDYNRVFNLNNSTAVFWEYVGGQPSPPDAYGNCVKDDYVEAFNNLAIEYYEESSLYMGFSPDMHQLPVILDYRNYVSSNQSDLNSLYPYFPNRVEPQGVIVYSCFGTNGDEGRNKDYLFVGGVEGGPPFTLVNGAVFTSLESFNAVTMFSDQTTSQAKIVDFIEIGGSGAIGHAFEPQADAAIDNGFLFYNLLADRDQDNIADLTFVEAAYSAIPYLSWSEVAIGDPLMRICYGPGEDQVWEPITGDVNRDGVVNIRDMVSLRNLNLSGGNPGLYDSIPEKRERYYDLCDLNQDGCNNIRDIVVLRNILYSY